MNLYSAYIEPEQVTLMKRESGTNMKSEKITSI